MNQHNKADFIYGTRAIIEAIEAGREIDKLLIQKDVRNELMTELLKVGKTYGVPHQKVPIEKLNRVTRKNHQGAIAYISSVQFASLDNVISEAYSKGEVPFLVILDRITDMRNFGAICRTAECAGVHALVVPSRGNAQIGSDAMKTSAGALNYIPICRSDNLKTAIQELKSNGLKIVACSEKADDIIFEVDLKDPLALIVGSEEDGISNEYLKFSDVHAKLPIEGRIDSLNVSVAMGVIVYEALRQRVS